MSSFSMAHCCIYFWRYVGLRVGFCVIRPGNIIQWKRTMEFSQAIPRSAIAACLWLHTIIGFKLISDKVPAHSNRFDGICVVWITFYTNLKVNTAYDQNIHSQKQAAKQSGDLLEHFVFAPNSKSKRKCLLKTMNIRQAISLAWNPCSNISRPFFLFYSIAFPFLFAISFRIISCYRGTCDSYFIKCSTSRVSMFKQSSRTPFIASNA